MHTYIQAYIHILLAILNPVKPALHIQKTLTKIIRNLSDVQRRTVVGHFGSIRFVSDLRTDMTLYSRPVVCRSFIWRLDIILRDGEGYILVLSK